MQTAIATVSLSGTLNEKLEAIAAAAFRRRRDLRERSPVLPRLSRRGPADVRRSRAWHDHLPAVPRFRGHARAAARQGFDRAERKFDLMQELGCDLLLVCSNVSPEALGGDRPAGGRFPRDSASAPPSAACASATRRSPGAGTSTTTATPGRSSAGPTTRTSASSSTPSTSSPAARTFRRSAPSRATASSWCRSPTRRCSTWTYLSWSRHWRCMPGQGDLRSRRLHGRAERDRLRRATSRWRSSTTASAPARPARSRSTASAR